MQRKYDDLKTYLKELKSVVVAFSGGVDSMFLLSTALEVLGGNVLPIIISSDFFPKRELDEAIGFCEENNIKYEIIKINGFEIDEVKNNTKKRCYFCKKHMFKEIKKAAKKYNIETIIEGSNYGDRSDYRPGRVALNELGILSPLDTVKLTKDEIRILSKERNLKTWDKPSFACLATRFLCGDEITKEKLKMVDRAEQLLYDIGFHQFRVRVHRKLARIEIEEDEFEKMMDKNIKTKITEEFKALGFEYISLDLEGYRTGSMN